jgi:UDP-N-acetylmuramate--alanine ligase
VAESMEGRRIHFIGIGGAGMSGLALVCARLGADVSGSDPADSSYMERLRAVGIEPQLGHDRDLVPADAEVVISTAIAEDNPELALARERGQQVIHRGELLAELCAPRRLRDRGDSREDHHRRDVHLGPAGNRGRPRVLPRG